MILRTDFSQWCSAWLPSWDGVEQHPFVWLASLDRRWIQFLYDWHEDEGERIDSTNTLRDVRYRHRFKRARKALKILAYPDDDIRMYTEYAVPVLWSTVWNPDHDLNEGKESAIDLLARSLLERVTHVVDR